MSGLSARVSAVVVVVLLGGVVGLAMIGRRPTVAPVRFPVEAAVASPDPTAATEPPAPVPKTAIQLGNGLPFHLPTTPIVLADGWPADAPTPPPGHSHWVLGEDGIFGLPGYPWRADDTPVTVSPPPARRFFNWMSGGPGRSYRR